MSAELLNFPTAEAPATPVPVRDKVAARMAFIVKQTNAENADDEETTHKKNTSLIEQVNHLDAQMMPLATEAEKRGQEWKSHDNQASDVPFVGKKILTVVLVATVLGELVLSATALQGLGVSDIETYVMAFGTVAAAVFGVKAIAHGMRWLPTRLGQKPLAYFEIAMLVLSLVGLIGILWGMSEARVGYSAADHGSGGKGLSESTTHGLAWLQGAMYAVQIAVFYFLAGPNMVADRARVNYEKAHKKLTDLHAKRAKFASRLNENVLRLAARHDARVQRASQLCADWLSDMHIQGKGEWFAPGSGVETEIRQDWFEIVNSRLCQPVDAPPLWVQQVLQGSNGNDMTTPTQEKTA